MASWSTLVLTTVCDWQRWYQQQQSCCAQKTHTGGFTGSTGSLGGAFTTPVSKMWAIFNAFGVLFFTWGCAFVLMEIVDTIGTQPIRRARKGLNGYGVDVG